MTYHTDSLLTVAEIAGYLRVSKPTVYRLMAEGLPYFQLREGGDRRLALDDVLAWIESRKVAAP